MRRIIQLSRWFLAVMACLVLLVCAGVAGMVWLASPGGNREDGVSGLSARVSIDIDQDGVPRVHAASEADAITALGYLHARERMFQMELMRRAASGELSELVGRATLPIDRMMRTLGVRRSAEADLAEVDAGTRAMLDAYARGVNAWIDARERFASEEFVVFGKPRPWQAVDCLLWAKTMGLYLSGNYRTELARQSLAGSFSPEAIDALWPDSPGGGHPEASLADPALEQAARKLAQALPDFPAPFTLPAMASNEWAVDGRHTATGAPLLAGDPHLAFSLPGIWYLARLEWPGHVLAGATAPGAPFLVIGHNGHVAWTFTTTGADVQDVFIETPVDADYYATPDGPRAYVTRSERIHMRGAPDEILAVRETRHGPVLSDIVNPRGPMLAVEMANLAPGDTAAAGLLALGRAGNVADAGRAAGVITAPAQNLLVADHDGIGLFVTGRVPIRRAGDGSRPVAGADGAHDWTGFASGEQLPRVVAPSSGRIVNANERVAPRDFPVFMGRDYYGDWRARRIRALLDTSDRHTAAGFAAMQVDATSLAARDLLPRLRTVTATTDLSRKALVLLANWDGRMAIDLPQPLILNAWMERLYLAILTCAGVPPDARAAAAPWPETITHVLTPNGAAMCGGDCAAMLSETLAEAMRDLAARVGDEPASWRWGDLHQAVFAPPLLRAVPWLDALTQTRIEAPGDDTTIDRGGLDPRNFTAIHGASYRGVYDLSDLDRSLFVVAPGQSGHVTSPLARNFVTRWRNGETITLGHAPERVDAYISLVPVGATR